MISSKEMKKDIEDLIEIYGEDQVNHTILYNNKGIIPKDFGKGIPLPLFQYKTFLNFRNSNDKEEKKQAKIALENFRHSIKIIKKTKAKKSLKEEFIIKVRFYLNSKH